MGAGGIKLFSPCSAFCRHWLLLSTWYFRFPLKVYSLVAHPPTPPPPHTQVYTNGYFLPHILLIFENMAFIILNNTVTLYQQNVEGRTSYRTALSPKNLETGFGFRRVILDGVLFKKCLSTAVLGQWLSHFPQATQWSAMALTRVGADIRHWPLTLAALLCVLIPGKRGRWVRLAYNWGQFTSLCISSKMAFAFPKLIKM